MVLPRCRQLVLLTATIALFFQRSAVTAQNVGRRTVKSDERTERLLQAVAAGEESESDLVPRLVGIVEHGEPDAAELAIRALARLKSKASPAVPALCRKLSNASHSTRRLAADALVMIGESSVAPLRALLNFTSGRTRAAATHALSRLKRIDMSDLEKLVKDADPRVRGAAASALGAFGKPGVKPLVDLLSDPEAAVAVEAARALQSNRSDPPDAIRGLIQALARADVGWAAAGALAAYGVEANRAVPWMIKAYPLGGMDRFDWEDAVEEALEHIGPPHELDIPELCQCLTQEEPEKRILAAKSLALLGMKGKAAAPALERAAEAAVKQSVVQEQEFAARPNDQNNNAGQLFGAAEECAAAYWAVTHDAPRFLNLLEKIVVTANAAVRFSHPAPWDEFSADDWRSIEKLLRHPNHRLRQTALLALSETGPSVVPLKGLLLEMARGRDAEISKVALHALANMGPTAADDVAPLLVGKLRDGTLPLHAFADAVRSLKVRSAEIEALLEPGLEDTDRSTANACAEALCSTSNDPRRAASQVIAATRGGRLRDRDALEALTFLKGGEDAVIPFLAKHLQGYDNWTRQAAVNALGAIGKNASMTLPALRMLLDDEACGIRLSAGKTVYLIAGDSKPLENELERMFARSDLGDRADAVGAVGELKQAGTKFLPFLLTALDSSEPELACRACEALTVIGTPDAVAALQKVAESRDWKIRSQALAGLRRMQSPAGNGEK